jgi:hypothetical protein
MPPIVCVESNFVRPLRHFRSYQVLILCLIYPRVEPALGQSLYLSIASTALAQSIIDRRVTGGAGPGSEMVRQETKQPRKLCSTRGVCVSKPERVQAVGTNNKLPISTRLKSRR